MDVDQALAERIAEVARLLREDTGDPDAALHRLVALGIELVPGATAGGVSVLAGKRAHTFAASDPRVQELHRLQFDSGQGPLVETLRYNEPRHVRDTATEKRWPRYSRAAADAGFGSCLELPLRTDHRLAGAIVLYGSRSDVFSGASHDLALLLAAQGSVAVYNAKLYEASRQMVRNLETGLRHRLVIEQAKGILRARLGLSAKEAFDVLRQMSNESNRKIRDIAAELVQDTAKHR